MIVSSTSFMILDKLKPIVSSPKLSTKVTTFTVPHRKGDTSPEAGAEIQARSIWAVQAFLD
jgi:hypothetical protein